MPITLNDFIPPLVPKVIRRLKRRFGKKNHEISYPFSHIPRDITACVIYDIGANIGGVTRSALESYPQARVVCFEPVQSTAQVLQQAVAGFEERVEIHRIGMSSRRRKARINITPFHGANSLEGQARLYKIAHPQLSEEAIEEIQLTTLDEFHKHRNRELIDVVKIDVEGHELNVLKGGRRTLKNHVRIVILEISFYRDHNVHDQKFMKIFSFLQNLGFYVVNMFDLAQKTSKESDMPVLVEQFDCVFRNAKFDKRH